MAMRLWTIVEFRKFAIFFHTLVCVTFHVMRPQILCFVSNFLISEICHDILLDLTLSWNAIQNTWSSNNQIALMCFFFPTYLHFPKELSRIAIPITVQISLEKHDWVLHYWTMIWAICASVNVPKNLYILTLEFNVGASSILTRF